MDFEENTALPAGTGESGSQQFVGATDTPIIAHNSNGSNGKNTPPIGAIRPIKVMTRDRQDRVNNPFTTALLTLEQLYAMPDQENWLLDDLLCRGDIGMIFGDSASGKTYLAVDMLVTIAAGDSWCNGRFPARHPRRVIYTTGEGRRGIRKRFYARENLYRQRGGEEWLNIYTVLSTPQLFDRESNYSVDHFIWAIEYRGLAPVDLVVIDTMSRASLGADENSSKDAALIIAGAEYLRDTLGCAVLLIHHSNKMGGYRGSTALRGAMDICLEVRKTGNNSHLLHWDKVKDGDMCEDLGFHFYNYEDSSVIEWDGERMLNNQNEDIIMDFLKKCAGKRMSVPEIANATGIRKSSITKLLQGSLSKFVHHEYLHTDQKKPLKGATNNPMVYWINAL